MNRSKWSKIITIATIILSVAMILIVILNNDELENAWDVICGMDKGWLTACIACYALYIFSEGAGLCAFLRMEGYRVKLTTAAHFSFAGMYYANITPSSTGGQPMQVYLMSQRGVSGGVATSALTARYFFNQLCLVLTALVLWLTNRSFVAGQLGHVQGLIILGMIVNVSCVPIVVLVMLNRPLTERLACWIIRLLGRRKLCKHPETLETRALATLGRFHDSLADLVHRPLHLAIQFMVSMVEMAALLVVPLLVYAALDQSGTPWYHLLTASYLLFVSASYTPLPGASGAQEGGFMVYFSGMFKGGTLSVALLVWRFMTYYLCLLAGAVDQVYSGLRARRKPIDQQRPEEKETL